MLVTVLVDAARAKSRSDGNAPELSLQGFENLDAQMPAYLDRQIRIIAVTLGVWHHCFFARAAQVAGVDGVFRTSDAG